MSHTKDRRGPGTQPTNQEQVVIGVLMALDETENTAIGVAEALTEAQMFLSPDERIDTPVSSRTAGQYLGLLRTRGLARCEPPHDQLVTHGRRRWFLAGAGEQVS